MEAYEFLRNRQMINPDTSLHETAVPNFTWGDLIKLLDDYLKAQTAKAVGVDALVMPKPIAWGCKKCNKIDWADSAEQLAKPEHVSHRGVDIGTCDGEFIPLFSA